MPDREQSMIKAEWQREQSPVRGGGGRGLGRAGSPGRHAAGAGGTPPEFSWANSAAFLDAVVVRLGGGAAGGAAGHMVG
jgi:hypothetical protein